MDKVLWDLSSGFIAGVAITLFMFVVFVAAVFVLNYKKISASYARMDEHDELLAWAMQEFERGTPELNAVVDMLSNFEDWQKGTADVLRGLISKAPRRVTNDLRSVLYEYDQWKAGQQ